IATARLLLPINRERPAGIGNAYDQVGRYGQEHLWYASGMLVLAEPLDHDPLYLREHEIGGFDGYAVRAHLGLTPEAEAKHKLSGFRAEVFGASEKDAHLWRLGSGQVSGAEIAQILGRIDDFAAQRLCDVPRAPTVVTLMNYFQMRPYADNRVTLGETRDRFGRPLPALDFRVRPEEHASLRRTHEIIAEDVARRGIGRLRIEIDPEEDPPLPGRSYGAHHIGTARMSDDPKEGVTDRDARVHETENLYIAGSAIYPVCGWQNPTFTIVATSIKLADHLKRRATLEGVL
ncbi:MAG: GMC family oxidoreductase, partial [Pseudomonadota bacterium]